MSDEIENLQQEGLREKSKYAEYIPEGFDQSCEAIREKDKAYSKEFGMDVRARYDDLRRENKIPATSARIIVVGEFAGIRDEKTLLRYLPDECKSERHQIAADASNVVQEPKRKIKRVLKQKEMADKAIAELHEEHPEIPIMPVNPVVEQTPKEEEIEIPVKPGIFTRMLAMCIKTNETFTLKVNVVSKTLVDVMSNEEGEPEPAAPRPR